MLAAPVVAEQQPLQRQGQGCWAAASGVLPIWRLMLLLLLLTLHALGLRQACILSSAIAACLGAGGSASGFTQEWHRHRAGSMCTECSGAASPTHSPSACPICCRLFWRSQTGTVEQLHCTESSGAPPTSSAEGTSDRVRQVQGISSAHMKGSSSSTHGQPSAASDADGTQQHHTPSAHSTSASSACIPPSLQPPLVASCWQ